MLIAAGTLTVLAGLLYWINCWMNDVDLNLLGVVRVLLLMSAALIGLNCVIHFA